MKNLTMAMTILATLVLVTVISGCGEPAPAALDQPAVPRDTSTATPEAMLEEVHLATLWSIQDLAIRGQPVPEDQYEIAWSIEEAQKVLQVLEDQRVATQTFVSQCITGCYPVPNFEHAILESIEEARCEVLAKVGVVD